MAAPCGRGSDRREPWQRPGQRQMAAAPSGTGWERDRTRTRTRTLPRTRTRPRIRERRVDTSTEPDCAATRGYGSGTIGHGYGSGYGHGYGSGYGYGFGHGSGLDLIPRRELRLLEPALVGIVDPHRRAALDGVDERFRNLGPNRGAAPPAADDVVVGPRVGDVVGAVDDDESLAGVVVDALLEAVETEGVAVPALIGLGGDESRGSTSCFPGDSRSPSPAPCRRPNRGGCPCRGRRFPRREPSPRPCR